MSWLFDPSAWVDNVTVPMVLDFQHIAADIHTWGANVDAASHSLVNLTGLTGYGNALAITGGIVSVYQDANILGAGTIASTQFCVRGASDPNRILACGYDTTSDLGIIQAYHNSVAVKPLALQPVGGTVGIGVTAPTISGSGFLHCAGDTVRLTPTSRTPANSAAAGNDGELCMDNGFVYGHMGGSWRRAAWVTF